MEVIQYIKSSQRIIPLAAAFKPPFQKFFKFDSLNVVIGENGAGKTTLLMNLAECLQHRDESRVTGIEYSTNENSSVENIRWRTGPLPGLGIVFYTPLPYRRELVQSPKLIDASPKYSNQTTKPKIAIFREVAASLKIDTELCGTISFSPAVMTRILFPTLANNGCKPNNVEWQREALAMHRARQEMQKLEASEDPDFSVDKALIDLKEVYRRAEQSLTEMMLEQFQHDCPPDMFHPLIALASLQKLARTSKDRPQLARSFLELMNVATFTSGQPINYSRRFVAQMFATAQQTASCILGQNIRRDSQTHSFPIDEKLQRVAMRPGVAVTLSWSHLPSGLLALVDQLSRLKVAVEQQIKRGCSHLLILIDEGDAYLHLDWQRRYIKLLDDFLGDIKGKNMNIGLQVVLTSHSLLLAGDVPSNMIINLKGELKDDVRTFASPLDQLAFRSFKSYSVGEFAAHKINELHKKILIGELTKDDKALIDQIGDTGVRNALIRAIDNQSDTAGAKA